MPVAREALELAQEYKERGNAAWVFELLGNISTHREPPEVKQAEEYYRQALAAELGMRPLLAHYHRGLGTLYAKLGRREQAHVDLSTAIELYRAMDMTFWLPQAEAALAQVEGRLWTMRRSSSRFSRSSGTRSGCPIPSSSGGLRDRGRSQTRSVGPGRHTKHRRPAAGDR
jgi:tetratricopeptide (TPR) repeat protein